MKKRDYKLFIHDILEGINKIFRYTENMSYEDFINDEKTIDAITRNFEIMGEAVKNLPDKIRQQFPEIPFKLIAGMRDKIIHGYFGIDYDEVWSTINNDLPKLKPQIENALKLLEEN